MDDVHPFRIAVPDAVLTDLRAAAARHTLAGGRDPRGLDGRKASRSPTCKRSVPTGASVYDWRRPRLL